VANVGPPVLYLPPGVIVPAAPVPPPNSPPFDRAFFERVLPEAVRAFCEQAKCEEPVVELLTIDGERHYVRGVSGVADQWVALHTVNPDHPHPVQVFLPYATVYRVEIHPEMDERRGIGFVQPRRTAQE
jgi:hypothetical protein